MQRTRVKICGITQRQDALDAVVAGADAIGLVFYAPSPRAVRIAQAKKIVAGLPPFVTVVGLFVDADAAVVKDTIAQVGLDCLQFHGNETAAYCEQFTLPYFKAIRMEAGLDLSAEVIKYDGAIAILLDSYQAGTPGGTGETFDWETIPALDKPLILAGGLDAKNIKHAIHTVQPYAVDVSGGVEATKGIKSPQKIAAFMEEVNHV